MWQKCLKGMYVFSVYLWLFLSLRCSLPRFSSHNTWNLTFCFLEVRPLIFHDLSNQDKAVFWQESPMCQPGKVGFSLTSSATFLINNQFRHCIIYCLSMHHRPGSASAMRLLVMWIRGLYFHLHIFLFSFRAWFIIIFCVLWNISWNIKISNSNPDYIYFPHCSHHLSFLFLNVPKIYCPWRFSILALTHWLQCLAAGRYDNIYRQNEMSIAYNVVQRF